MDHHLRLGASAEIEDWISITLEEDLEAYIPRFVNIGVSTNVSDFVRGYGFQGSAKRDPNNGNGSNEAYGSKFRSNSDSWTMENKPWWFWRNITLP